MKFNLKRPCGNCPFLRDRKKAIDLRPGRVLGIAKSLLKSDYVTFPCHKTTGGARPTKNSSACAGALIFSLVNGQMSVLTRIALANGSDLAAYKRQSRNIVTLATVKENNL